MLKLQAPLGLLLLAGEVLQLQPLRLLQGKRFVQHLFCSWEHRPRTREHVRWPSPTRIEVCTHVRWRSVLFFVSRSFVAPSHCHLASATLLQHRDDTRCPLGQPDSGIEEQRPFPSGVRWSFGVCWRSEMLVHDLHRKEKETHKRRLHSHNQAASNPHAAVQPSSLHLTPNNNAKIC